MSMAEQIDLGMTVWKGSIGPGDKDVTIPSCLTPAPWVVSV